MLVIFTMGLKNILIKAQLNPVPTVKKSHLPFASAMGCLVIITDFPHSR